MEPVQAQFQNPETCGQNTDTAGHTREGFRGLCGTQYDALDRSLSHCDTHPATPWLFVFNIAQLFAFNWRTPFGFVS